MAELEEKIKEISNMYRNLQKFENPSQQYYILQKLDKLCVQSNNMLDKALPTPENRRRLKQVKDIQNKIQLLKKQKPKSILMQSVVSQANKSMSRQQMSRKIARTIAFEQLRSTQLKVSPQQIEKVAKRMENNLELMKQIQCMVVQQGQNLDIIQSNIIQAYQQMNDTNKELDQAAQIQNKTRLMKIRAGVTGILATIGWGIFGIPGMIVGLFSGWRATK